MQLTKETLRVFLDERPAIESSALCRDAGVHERAIAQLYSLNRNLTDRLKGKLLKVIHLYGWKYCIKCGANGALKDGLCYGCEKLRG